MAPTKQCKKCGKEYPATPEYFHCEKTGKHGVKSQCKACVNARHREKHSEYRVAQREWLSQNKGRLKEYRRRWSKKWKKENPEKRKELAKKYRNSPKGIKSHAERNRRWRKNNPDTVASLAARRRAQKANSAGSFTKEDIRLIGEQQGWRCWWCQKSVRSNYHIDHRIPLSRGGSNDANNIVISCQHCNLRKHSKLPHEWMGRLL